MTTTILFCIALLAYSLLFYWLYKQNTDTTETYTNRNMLDIRIMSIFMITLICHGALLCLVMLPSGGVNLALGLMFSMIMLCVITAYLLWCFQQSELIGLGIVILPITILALVIGYFYPGQTMLFNELSLKLKWHVLFALPAFIFVCLAFAQSILLLIAEHQLRNPKKNRLIEQIPALDSMDNFLVLLITTSFILISVNIILGVLTVVNSPSISFTIDHHFVLSILSWLCLFSLLIGRKVAGWRTAVAAKWTISAFLFIFLAYFGTRFVTQVLLV